MYLNKTFTMYFKNPMMQLLLKKKRIKPLETKVLMSDSAFKISSSLKKGKK